MNCLVGPDGWEVDHANHDGLDNRRANLRLATRSQNIANQRKKRGASSYKGVYRLRDCNRWGAQIYRNGSKRHLGTFKDEVDAALAYDCALLEASGPFAKLNFLRPV